LTDRNAHRGRISAVSATVYIHTNDQQYVGAPVAPDTIQRTPRHADRFDV
jgi:hypothetical protein